MAVSLSWLPMVRLGLAKWHTSGRPLPLSSGLVPLTPCMARSASPHRLNWTCVEGRGGISTQRSTTNAGMASCCLQSRACNHASSVDWLLARRKSDTTHHAAAAALVVWPPHKADFLNLSKVCKHRHQVLLCARCGDLADKEPRNACRTADLCGKARQIW